MEEAKQLLAKLSKLGTFITNDSALTPLLTGRVVSILPSTVVRESCQTRCVQVFHLTDVFPNRELDGSCIKIIFSDEVAQTVSKLSLKGGDYVALTNVLLSKNSDYETDCLFLNIVAHVGPTAPYNVLTQVLYRHANSSVWIRAVGPYCVLDVGQCVDRRLRVVPKWTKTARVILRRCDDLYESSYLRPVLTKLTAIGENNNKVNVMGIVCHIVEEPKLISSGRYRTIFTIVDETLTKARDAIEIRLYFRTKPEDPRIQLHSILFISLVRFNLKETKIYAKVNIEQVTTFDWRHVEIFRTRNSGFQLTNEIKKNFNFLREWLSANAKKLNRECLSLLKEPKIACLKDVSWNAQKMTITGTVREKKLYTEGAILRVDDGTKCVVPFVRYAVESNSWISALSETQRIRSSSEVDIVITSLESPLTDILHSRLNVGGKVRLHDVDLKVCLFQGKGKWQSSMKASLKGNVKNVDILDDGFENRRSENLKRLFDINHQNAARRRLCSNDENPSGLVNIENDTVENKHFFLGSKTVDLSVAPFQLQKPCPKSKKAAAEMKDTVDTNVFSSKYNLADNSQSSNTSKDFQTTHTQASFKDSIMKWLMKEMPSSFLFTALARVSNLGGAFHPSISNQMSQQFSGMTGREINVRSQVTDNTIERISEETDNFTYSSCWPQEPEVNKLFHMKAYLMATIPIIDVNGRDLTVLNLIRGYCNICDSFCVSNAMEWLLNLDKETTSAICPKCSKTKQFGDLRLVLACTFFLMDELKHTEKTVVLGKSAENIFGFTATQLITNHSECQRKVQEFGRKHLFFVGKENPVLKCTLVPMKNKREKIDFHLIRLSQF